MANIKSSAKRAKTATVRALRNKSVLSSVKTAIKNFEAAATSKDAGQAKTALSAAIRSIDKAATKGLLHKSNAANKKSRLTKMFNKIVG